MKLVRPRDICMSAFSVFRGFGASGQVSFALGLSHRIDFDQEIWEAREL